MKKTLVILVVLLAAASVFAASKPELYAGANLGLNIASRTYKSSVTVLGTTTTSSTKFTETDFQFGVSGDYFFDGTMGVSASVAVNAPLAASGVSSVKVGSNSPSSTSFDCDAKSGVVFGADFAYKYKLDKKASVVGKAGLAITTVKSVNEDANTSTQSTVFAIDLKGEYRYNLQDNLYVGGGAAFDLPVAASTKVTVGSTTDKSDDKFSGFGLTAYAYAGMKF